MSTHVLSDIAYRSVSAAAADPSQSLVTLLFTCAWIESVVNVMLDALDDDWGPQLNRVVAVAQEAGVDDRWTSLERRVRVLGAAATGKRIDFGRSPFQELGLLFDLRNWCVHWRPEAIVYRGAVRIWKTREAKRFVGRLVSVGVVPRSASRHPRTMSDVLHSPRLAPWSYVTGYRVVEELAAWFPRLRVLLRLHRPPLPAWTGK